MTQKLTPARLTALEATAAGRVKKRWPLGTGKARFILIEPSDWPRQSPYVWLTGNGFIRGEAPSLRGTKYIVTALGQAYLDEHASDRA